MTLYVYAILLGAAAPPPNVRLESHEGLLVALQDRGAPAVSEQALRAHDRVVRGLAAGAEAILPARFGTVFTDAESLAQTLRERRDELHAGLARVSGKEQMTLRLFGPAAARRASAPDEGLADSGLAWLRARSDEQRIPELDAVRRALSDIVVDERCERRDRPPLIATAYHLIGRGDAPQYRLALTRTIAGAEPLMRVTASGPWPPYAFAPGVWP